MYYVEGGAIWFAGPDITQYLLSVGKHGKRRAPSRFSATFVTKYREQITNAGAAWGKTYCCVMGEIFMVRRGK